MTRTASLTPPFFAGRTLGGKFEIVGILGEGGTGVVYDAVRLPERDPVALKVIHNHLLMDPQIRGRFTREAAILRRLEGPHLSAILEFGELPDPRHDDVSLLYMALPKIEGPALEAVLRAEGLLSIDRAFDIMVQITGALQAAHVQGVIHRDLKPANVILRDGTHAIVVDFGMAKIVTGSGTGTTALTTGNMVFGTPEYMSPEQARGDELDARCDVYAAGVILYELLTGRVPFVGATPLNVLTAHLTSEVEPPRAKAPDRGISKALEAVVLHAMAKDPARRYASAAALQAALVHARSSPDDVASVAPEAFSPMGHVDTEETHAPTIPAPIPTDPPKAADANVGTARTWAMVAIIAVVSVAIGILLSLR